MNRPDDRNPHAQVPHLDEHRCLDIVHGLVRGPSLEEALAHARACAECELRLRRVAADFEALRVRQERDENATAAGTAVPSTVRVWRPWTDARVWAPLAAAAALAAVFVFRPHAPSPPVEPSRWISVDHDLVRTRGASSEADSLLWRGLAAYEQHDSAGAARLLSASHGTGGDEDLRRLYLASALVMTSKPAEALAVLEDLQPATLPEPWRSEGLWVRYLALEQAGHRGEAAAQLRELADAPGAVGALARERSH